MKVLRNEKGFTLIELVLIIVILGILGAVATVQFASLVSDANNAALDGAPGLYSAQLAVSISNLSRVPTCAEFDTDVHQNVTVSGGNITRAISGCLLGASSVTYTITATCEDVWNYTDATTATPGEFVRDGAASDRSAC